MAEEQPAIEIKRAGVSGKVVENVFFHDSGKQISSFWGIASFEELNQKESINLPPVAHRYIQDKFDESRSDGKESGASFGWKENGVTIDNVRTGKNSFNDYVGRRVNGIHLRLDNVRDIIKQSVDRWFGEPQPVEFHLHPAADKEMLEGTVITLPNGDEIAVNGEQMAESFDFALGSFSSHDLFKYTTAHRYVNSCLLATKEGMLYIVPSKLQMPYGMTKLDTSHKSYDKEVELLNVVAMMHIFGLREDQVIPKSTLVRFLFGKRFQKAVEVYKSTSDLNSCKELRDAALLKWCKENGMNLFKSQSLDDPVLKRIS